MNVREIVEKYLRDNGFDGLYTDDCGCEAGDLFPCCNEHVAHCVPGHKVPCDPETCDGECEFHIGRKE